MSFDMRSLGNETVNFLKHLFIASSTSTVETDKDRSKRELQMGRNLMRTQKVTTSSGNDLRQSDIQAAHPRHWRLYNSTNSRNETEKRYRSCFSATLLLIIQFTIPCLGFHIDPSFIVSPIAYDVNGFSPRRRKVSLMSQLRPFPFWTNSIHVIWWIIRCCHLGRSFF